MSNTHPAAAPPAPALPSAQVSRHWFGSTPIRPLPDGGLINQTFVVGAPSIAALQWLNPIFPAAVNHDIDAVTSHLASQGLITPRVLRTQDGELWVDDPGGGCWRVLSWVPGRTVHRVDSAALAYAAGSTLGRFHNALHSWDPVRVAPVRQIHDTQARMDELESALRSSHDHPLFASVEPVAAEVLERWSTWAGSTTLPQRTCHGDPKISNIRFSTGDDTGICMIDLDTVGPQSLDCELGDAWRSWCNPAGEDDPDAARVDLERFAASAAGFLDHAPTLHPDEASALVGGLERICLELAARFARDALLNSYFKEDRQRFPAVGAHNLHRAQGQLVLARDARAQRRACDRIFQEALAQSTGRR